MKKDILKGILFTNIILIIVGLLQIYTNKYFVYNLGLEKFGLIKLFEQILGYLSLTELGLGSASTFALYKPLANNDYARVKEIIYTIQKLYTKIIILFLIFGTLATFILPVVIKTMVVDYTIIIYWIMYLISSALTYVMAKYIVLYNADRRVDFVKISQGIILIFLKVAQLLSLIFLKSLFVFILLIIISNIIGIIVFYGYYKKNYKYLDCISSNGFVIDKSIIKDVRQVFVHRMCYVLAVNTDVIIISGFLSLEVAGLYAGYSTIMMMILSFVVNINGIIRPYIGRFIALNTKDKVYTRFKELNILYLFASLVLGVAIYNLIQPFMSIWIHNKFNDVGIVCLLCLSVSFLIYRECLEIFKMGSGFFSDIHLPIIEALLNLIVSLILVNYIGVLGVVIGTVLSQIVVYLVLKPILTYRECFNKSYSVYLKDYAKYLIYAIVSVFISQSIINNMNINIKSFIDLISKGIIVVTVLLILNILIFSTDKEFRQKFIYIINLIRSKMI